MDDSSEDIQVVGVVKRIPLQLVRAQIGQPRTYFCPIKLQELADSIQAVGQKVPGIVRRLDKSDSSGCTYELVDGERRLRACRIISAPFFKAYEEGAGEAADPDAQFEAAIVANFNRENHTIMETARAVRRFRIKKKRYQRDYGHVWEILHMG